ncbi:MAG: two-component system OmpR family sensor kinase [Brevundimonas sp.]|jgi:two-component system OmpR family sensor kinase|uniref:sensor histidine kinase n=1 Tax=Brevundimonas sp. TaxID=1871086 RepID=UPI00248A8427|nr:ATP-binding protein [Brevundimonas sp.]MDI1280954.1 ATP-binding protein [Brevundimonas sp.]
MKSPTALPVLVQVAALATLAVVMSQAVAFGVVLLAPEPRPAGFSIEAAAEALEGRPAETSDGRTLKRHLSDKAPTLAGSPREPLALAISAGLAQRLQVQPDALRVTVPPRAPGPGRGPPPPRTDDNRTELVFVRPGIQGPDADGGETLHWNRQVEPGETVDRPGPTREVRAEVHMRHMAPAGAEAITIDTTTHQFTIVTDKLTFAPFSAALRLPDGRWASVTPPHGLLSPWQVRILIALGISLLLLAPLVWVMARRLTRPIRVFAEAAERLGADPDAEPMVASGPTEVRTAIHAFNDMQAALRDHMRRRSQTVAAIAHDLRTPLTRLRFRAEQAPDSVRDRMAADIEEMDALIATAMAYVRGEAAPDRSEPFDLTVLAADCATGFSETGANVTFSGDAALPVVADPAALRRALANLIANAVKFGGGARVHAVAADGRAVVTVEDDGQGVPADELEAVFDPFHRGERSRSRETGGAGLGLTVARQAARAHGGDVVLENRNGGGLTARLTLPLT